MKKLDLMIFDFDGTLVTTGADLALSVNYTLASLKLEKKPEKEIISFVGDGIDTLIQRALGKDNARCHEEAMRIFADYYGKHLMDNTGLYPHVEDVLKAFENKTKIILTNKSYDFTLTIARKLNIDKYFTQIVGIDSTPFAKPDRRIIDYLLDKYGVAKEKTLITGDGRNDILAAKNSGILSCAYLNGLGGRKDLLNLNADYYCEDLLEIKSLFN
ncbi:MAG: HAD-IA family hydrolase [Smithella sp.]|jgi:phosphoglycolate phosphatase